MCLAIPGKIEQIASDKMAEINFDGIKKTASVELLPKAEIGDYVLVHAGFAIEIINEDEANKTLELIREMS